MLRHWPQVLCASVVVGTLLAAGFAMARCPIATRYDPRLWAANQQSLSGYYNYRLQYDYPWSNQPVRVVAPSSHASAIAAPQAISEPNEPAIAPQPSTVKSPLPQTNSK
jgi:hypothetical protein